MMYVDDHWVWHVHVKISGKEVVVSLEDDVNVRDLKGRPSQSDIKKARRITKQNLGKLREAWEKIHGRG